MKPQPLAAGEVRLPCGAGQGPAGWGPWRLRKAWHRLRMLYTRSSELLRMGKDWLRFAALLFPVLTGCLSHTRKLQQPKLAGPVLNADVEELVMQINQRYSQVDSLTASVEFYASVGGAHRGKRTDYTAFPGYILFRKPQMLRVIGLVPVLRTQAFNLASNGETFTLLIPPKNRAIRGNNTVPSHSSNPLENLRPEIFLQAILIQSVPSDRIVSVIHESSTSLNPKTKQLIEQPEYDLTELSAATPTPGPVLAQVAKPLRVIRFSRLNLMPTEVDIYNANADLESQIMYGPYRDFNGFKFPSTIDINRPLDEFSVKLVVEKLSVNLPLPDKQFELEIPKGTQIQTLQ